MKYPAEAHQWHKESNYIVSLSIANEVELEKLAKRVERAGLKVVRFLEPDLGLTLTAICIEPAPKSLRKLTSSLPLMLKDLNMVQCLKNP